MIASPALLDDTFQLRKVLNVLSVRMDGTKRNWDLSFVKVALQANGQTERLAIPRRASTAQREDSGTKLSWAPVRANAVNRENIPIF